MFYTDTEILSSIINKQTTRITSIMFLIRKLVWLFLRPNIEFKARHISGKLNYTADALYHLQVEV